MPRTASFTRAILPPATIATVNRIKARRLELEHANGDGPADAAGRIAGLMEAEAMILEAACDSANDSASPL